MLLFTGSRVRRTYMQRASRHFLFVINDSPKWRRWLKGLGWNVAQRWRVILVKTKKKTKAASIFAQSPKSLKSAGFILSLNDSYCHKAICKPRQDGLAAWRLPKAISLSSQVALTLEFQAIWEPVMFPTKNKVKLCTAISRQLFTAVHIYGTTNERKKHLWRLN